MASEAALAHIDELLFPYEGFGGVPETPRIPPNPHESASNGAVHLVPFHVDPFANLDRSPGLREDPDFPDAMGPDLMSQALDEADLNSSPLHLGRPSRTAYASPILPVLDPSQFLVQSAFESNTDLSSADWNQILGQAREGDDAPPNVPWDGTASSSAIGCIPSTLDHFGPMDHCGGSSSSLAHGGPPWSTALEPPGYRDSHQERIVGWTSWGDPARGSMSCSPISSKEAQGARRPGRPKVESANLARSLQQAPSMKRDIKRRQKTLKRVEYPFIIILGLALQGRLSSRNDHIYNFIHRYFRKKTEHVSLWRGSVRHALNTKKFFTKYHKSWCKGKVWGLRPDSVHYAFQCAIGAFERHREEYIQAMTHPDPALFHAMVQVLRDGPSVANEDQPQLPLNFRDEAHQSLTASLATTTKSVSLSLPPISMAGVSQGLHWDLRPVRVLKGEAILRPEAELSNDSLQDASECSFQSSQSDKESPHGLHCDLYLDQASSLEVEADPPAGPCGCPNLADLTDQYINMRW